MFPGIHSIVQQNTSCQYRERIWVVFQEFSLRLHNQVESPASVAEIGLTYSVSAILVSTLYPTAAILCWCPLFILKISKAPSVSTKLETPSLCRGSYTKKTSLRYMTLRNCSECAKPCLPKNVYCKRENISLASSSPPPPSRCSSVSFWKYLFLQE